MEPIPLSELPRFSPWPARLLGLEHWSPVDRRIEHVDAEYEQDKYARVLEFCERNPGAPAEEVLWFSIGEPRDEKIRPRSGYHAQFSGPFTVAAALLGGGGLGVYFDDFSDAMAHDPARLALAAKVTTVVDPACDAVFPREFPAVLRVHLSDGRVLEERVMHNRGGPHRPLSDAELEHKFALNASLALAPAAVARLAESVFAMRRAESVSPLLSLTAADF